jgi:hypothetical protein
MPTINELVKKIFATDQAAPAAAIRETWIDTLDASERKQRNAARRLLDWYHKKNDKIVEHLRTAAVLTFDPEEIATWQWPLINGVQRTIRRISMTYAQPPRRTLYLGDEELPADHDAYKQVDEMYSHLDRDKKMRQAERYAKLFNTCHIEIVPRDNAIDWDIKLRPGTSVVEKPWDYLSYEKIAFEWRAVDPDTLTPVDGWLFWTPERHEFKSGASHYGLSNEQGTNPYGGEIPVVIIRLLEQETYWGQFGADLVDIYEAINLQLANLNENVFMQTHGYPIAINCGFGENEKVIVGPRRPITVEDLTSEDVRPGIDFPKPDADIEVVMNYCDWLIKEVGSTYGMPAGANELDEKRLSGYAKFLDNIELLESRDEEIPEWQKVEDDELFPKSVMVWNYWAKTHKVKPIDERIIQKTVFEAVSFPEEPKSKIERFTMEKAAGVNSEINYLMVENNITEEQAEEMAIKYAEQRKTVSGITAPEMPVPPGFKSAAADDEPDEGADGDADADAEEAPENK